MNGKHRCRIPEGRAGRAQRSWRRRGRVGPEHRKGEGVSRPGKGKLSLAAPSPASLPTCERAPSVTSSQLLTSQPGAPSQSPTQTPPAAALVSAAAPHPYRPASRCPPLGRGSLQGPTPSPAHPENRGSAWEGTNRIKWRRLKNNIAAALSPSRTPATLGCEMGGAGG